ncbi:glycerophosphodiester phosphodiesterase family protein [Rufibacter immobilis]|uniref:glycerophosphodiester phosphodiesterase family protein n=1 Tax=Rufibacter immobilis TaxID=1348778 RepID=UPI0035EC5FF3
MRLFKPSFRLQVSAVGAGLALLLLGNASLAQQKEPLQNLNIKNTKELHQFFKYTGKDVPILSGHRGSIVKGFPENSIPSFEETLRHTPAFFEIDPRLTKDSVIVLMHDATLDRTTTGTGKVSDYTYAELKELKLKDVEGNVTEFGIPTLDEVIKWSKGKTVVNLDKKDVPLAMTVKKIKEHNAAAHVMVTVHNAKQAKYYYDQIEGIMMSAFVKTKKELESYEKAGVPWSSIMAYVGPEVKPETKEVIDLLHARGVMCMVSAAPTYDKLPDPAARRTAYQEVFKAGADVLESDLPIEAAAAIQNLLPSKSPKAKFFNRGPKKEKSAMVRQ